jgi:hypothetical protein
MMLREKIAYIILILVLLTVVVNLGSINSFLSFQTDKTLQFQDSIYVVPDHWNTTDEMNMTGKSGNAMTNGYVIFDAWDDWPEDHMGSKSKARLASMEDGGYVTVKSEIIKLGGKNVTREYYTNPSRDTNTTFDHMGVVYIFTKQDRNYCIEIHYFTTHDYNNQSYVKEIDDRVEDMMANMENKNYNWFTSTFDRLLNNKSVELNI